MGIPALAQTKPSSNQPAILGYDVCSWEGACRFRTPQDAASCDALPGLQDFPPQWHHPAPRRARVVKAPVPPPRCLATRVPTITSRSSNPASIAPAAIPTTGPWPLAALKSFSVHLDRASSLISGSPFPPRARITSNKSCSAPTRLEIPHPPSRLHQL